MDWSKYIPANARMFLGTALGDRGPITEKDFTPEEIRTLKDIYRTTTARNNELEQNYRNQMLDTPQEFRRGGHEGSYTDHQKELQRKADSYANTRNRTSITYGDYDVKSGENGAPIGQGWLSSLYQSVTDPRFALGGTLGSFRVTNNDGNLQADDVYGFKPSQDWWYKNAHQKGLGEILKRYWDQPGSLGEVLARKYMPNAQRPVNINLGKE